MQRAHLAGAQRGAPARPARPRLLCGHHPHGAVWSKGSRPWRHSWSAKRPIVPASIGQEPAGDLSNREALRVAQMMRKRDRMTPLEDPVVSARIVVWSHVSQVSLTLMSATSSAGSSPPAVPIPTHETPRRTPSLSLGRWAAIARTMSSGAAGAAAERGKGTNEDRLTSMPDRDHPTVGTRFAV